MEITGKIIAVLPANSGTSQRTGNAWMSQEYVIETVNEQFPRKCCFRIFGEDKIKNFNIQPGEMLTVSFDINAREYNGRWYNDISAWAVNRNVQAQAAAAAPSASEAFAQPSAAPFPPAPEAQSESSSDDLPF